MLGVELRSAYHLARAHLERGDLTIGGAVAHEGTKRAIQTGLNMSPYGVDLQHLHFQCHFADGKWDHAQEIADGFPVRVTSPPEAYLSSMALFIDVARGNPAVEERRAWIEPFWSARGFDTVHRARPAGRARPVAGRYRAGAGRGPGRDRRRRRPAVGLLAVGHQAGRGRAERARRPGRAGPGQPATTRPPAPKLAAAAELLRHRPRGSGVPQAAQVHPGSRGPRLAGPRRGGVPAGHRRQRPAGLAGGPGRVRSRLRATRSPAPGGGWPRRSPRRAAGTRPNEQWRLAAQTADRLAGQAAAPGAGRPGPPGQDRHGARRPAGRRACSRR